MRGYATHTALFMSGGAGVGGAAGAGASVEDVAAAVLFVATLPSWASVPELIIKPTGQGFM